MKNGTRSPPHQMLSLTVEYLSGDLKARDNCPIAGVLLCLLCGGIVTESLISFIDGEGVCVVFSLLLIKIILRTNTPSFRCGFCKHHISGIFSFSQSEHLCFYVGKIRGFGFDFWPFFFFSQFRGALIYIEFIFTSHLIFPFILLFLICFPLPVSDIIFISFWIKFSLFFNVFFPSSTNPSISISSYP